MNPSRALFRFIRHPARYGKDMATPATMPTAVAVVTLRNIQIPGDGYERVAMTADLTYPKTVKATLLPLVLLLPGGGGQPELYGLFMRHLATHGFAVLVLCQMRSVEASPLPDDAVVRGPRTCAAARN